ncbi:unnamed protein product [Dicrocoelium dendriticum]|nr:unnamed protein product [Dicrocoelium dendriticum]
MFGATWSLLLILPIVSMNTTTETEAPGTEACEAYCERHAGLVLSTLGSSNITEELQAKIETYLNCEDECLLAVARSH